MNKKKREKGLIIVIVILILLVLSLGGYIAYINFTNNNREVNNTEKEIQNNKLNKVINFNKKNCINADTEFTDDNYVVHRFGSSFNANGLSFSIDDDEKIVKIQARYDLMFPSKFSQEDIINGTVKYSEDIDLTFDKEVESIFTGLFNSDGIYGTVILFLLKDGTLEYMKYSDIYISQKYEHHPIEGVNDIIRFDNIYLNLKGSTGGKYTAIAYKIDGTYYDLSKLIKLD